MGQHHQPINAPLIGETMLANLTKYKKVVAAILSFLPAPAVMGILTACGVHFSEDVVVAVLGFVALVVTPTAVAKTTNTP
jgi:membrane-associated phospholipid phosphatase